MAAVCSSISLFMLPLINKNDGKDSNIKLMSETSQELVAFILDSLSAIIVSDLTPNTNNVLYNINKQFVKYE